MVSHQLWLAPSQRQSVSVNAVLGASAAVAIIVESLPAPVKDGGRITSTLVRARMLAAQTKGEPPTADVEKVTRDIEQRKNPIEERFRHQTLAACGETSEARCSARPTQTSSRRAACRMPRECTTVGT